MTRQDTPQISSLPAPFRRIGELSGFVGLIGLAVCLLVWIVIVILGKGHAEMRRHSIKGICSHGSFSLEFRSVH